jgi:hypothetical protein
MPKIKRVTDRNGDIRYTFFCPGCRAYHCFNDNWTWDKNYEKPSIADSILVRGVIRCHSFIGNGMIRFLNDSEHKLVGKTIELPDLEHLEIYRQMLNAEVKL